MLSMQDMFYGQSEPVWVMKSEKDDKKGDKKESGGPVMSTMPYYYPQYFPDYAAAAPEKKEAEKKDDKKETKVVMKVPICCGECVESVESALYRMKGVKSVDCQTRREKVTVVATTAAPADILMATKSVFRKSRMWTDMD
jgi:copper chaperone CopZ